MKKVIIIFFITMIIFTNLSGCKNDSSNNSKTASPEQNKANLSYEQYLSLIRNVSNSLSFDAIPMLLSSSTIDSPTIIIVNKDMSFGKKDYLTLNNKNADSTQNFIIYDDKDNGYRLVTGWIYTNNNFDDNLLYYKPDIFGDSNDFNNLLSYKNILIHVQLIKTLTSNTPEDDVKENEAVLISIVDYLSKLE